MVKARSIDVVSNSGPGKIAGIKISPCDGSGAFRNATDRAEHAPAGVRNSLRGGKSDERTQSPHRNGGRKHGKSSHEETFQPL
jgi:hypothetical protein